MNTPSKPSGATPPGAPPPGAIPDPSMEDILASIRRILSEDDDAGEALRPAEPADVLSLDASMLVEEPRPAAPAAVPVEQETKMNVPTAAADPVAAPADMAGPSRIGPAESPPAPVAPAAAEPEPLRSPLVAPEAAAAAASSVGELLRTLAAGRQPIAVHHGGPTIEDLVRLELRPLLKTWLDANLPPLVERLVRAEIERVVGRDLA